MAEPVVQSPEVKEIARNERGRRPASFALAILGAALALVGGVLLYARENLFDPAALSGRAQTALGDQRVRLALAQPITTAVLNSGPAKLVNVRPLIESVVTGALGTPPVKAAFGEAVKAQSEKLFERDPDAFLINLGDVASIAVQAMQAVSPQTARAIPKQIKGARVELISSAGSIKTIEMAEDVRVGGLVLPPLAALALLGSVLLARERRRGLVRVGLALAGASIIGLVLLAIGHAVLLSLFEDVVIHDAVEATWDALLGDLRQAFFIAAILSVVLASAARFASGQDFDPLAPFTRAGELLRARPQRTSAAFARGAGLIAIGLALILEPGLSLEVVAVLAGAWILYVGISELLSILAPISKREAAGRGRPRIMPLRVTALALAAAAVVIVVALVSGGNDAPARPPGPPSACNGYAELCSKRLDQLTVAATHNSMSAADEPGWFLPNQRYGIERQLDDGIRGLLIDTHYGIERGNERGFAGVITDLQKEQKTRQEVVGELGEPTVQKAEGLVGKLAFDGAPGKPQPYLCHVLCELGATKFSTALAGIDDWMNRHPDEFLIIFIEDVVSPGETAAAFKKSDLLRYAYAPDRSAPPPTLGELIESDHRLLVMAENDAGGARFPWYQQGFDLVQETPYTFTSVTQIEAPESCAPDRGNAGDPLFQINNWIEKIPRDPELAAKINSQKFLLGRARLCERIRGIEPNLLNVDYYDRGNVFGVANVLNGIPANAIPTVRTLP